MNGIIRVILMEFIVNTVNLVSSSPCNMVSIDLDICKKVPEQVTKTEISDQNVMIYEIKEDYGNQMRIGKVMAEGKLICPDSELLIERVVNHVFNTLYYSNIVMITSCYMINGVREMEVLEFNKRISSNEYVKLERKPIELNLKHDSKKFELMEIKPHPAKIKVSFEILFSHRSYYIVGDVKYGNILVDRHAPNDIFKVASIWATESGKVIIQILRVNNQCKIVRSRCILVVIEDRGFCREIYRSISPFL